MVPNDMVIPQPIFEYYKAIGNAVTPQGDHLYANIPVRGIPQVTAPADGDRAATIAGTFGACDANSHNAYECYVSPYVTAGLVVQTREQNRNHNFQDWEPLPEAFRPANAVPNRNLLGHTPHVERLTGEGLNSLLNINFPDGNDMQSRIKWSAELTARVSGTMKTLESKFKMHTGPPEHALNPSAPGWIKVNTADDGAVNHNVRRLTEVAAPIYSSIALGSSQANVVGIFSQQHWLPDCVGRGLQRRVDCATRLPQMQLSLDGVAPSTATLTRLNLFN
ncbi:hypothetical protein QAD02_006675 [Eretmocerus hayati]|uniref:Uncharacterized protein n=1 Tax=Eretmocerus hayati TaxID=131215 RepID=A0ACC2N2P5_9HYME|nr:hypothetical protein QAD02_006675 [Eretmocerus hayati]